eukprot:6408327-Alexandrium_andersonii.AAC.1
MASGRAMASSALYQAVLLRSVHRDRRIVSSPRQLYRAVAPPEAPNSVQRPSACPCTWLLRAVRGSRFDVVLATQ